VRWSREVERAERVGAGSTSRNGEEEEWEDIVGDERFAVV
jgi:hypothetical protein